MKKNQKLPPFGKFAEAAIQDVLWKQVFLEISQNSPVPETQAFNFIK